MYLSPIHQNLRSTLLQQAEEAFAKAPDLSGVVHGRRRITQGARGRRTALFPSRKNGVTVALESQIETLYCLLLERNPDVVGYRCQALEIEYAKGRCTFPDFLIRTNDHRWLVHEIKPSRKHLTDEVQDRLAMIETLLMHCGFDFTVIDASDLPDRIQLENLHLLYHRSIIKPWSQQECELALEQIAALSGAHPLREIHSYLADIGLSPSLADHLLFQGQLVADLSQPLKLDTLVGLPL